MVGLAVTLATVLLLSQECSDDRLLWSAADADVAELRLSLDGANIAILPPQTTSYPLACLSGLACLTASDSSGNVSAAACFQWEPDPGVFMEIMQPCALGCAPIPGGFGELSPGCCTAPAVVE